MTETEKKNPLLYLFGKTWKYSEGNRKMVVLYLLMFIVSECISTFWSPLVIASMINTVENEGITGSTIQKLLLLLLLFPIGTTLVWAFHGPARLLEEANAFLARANYKKFLLQGVMNMPLAWHTDHHSGDTIDKIEKGTASMYEFSSITFQFVKPIVKLVGCFGAVVYFSNLSAFVVLGTMIIGAWITVKIDTICSPHYRELSRYENRISESIFDSVSNISTVIILRVEKLVFNSIVQKVMEPLKLFKKNNSLNELKWFLTSLCCSVMTVIVLGRYFIEHLNSAEKVAIGSIYLMISYLDKISEIFYDFTSLYGWTIRRKFRMMNGEELANDFKPQIPTKHVLPTNWRNLEIRKLKFSYKGKSGECLHLDDINLAIRRGETLAFIGRPGSGKSTLLKIIRNLYHPESVELLADGQIVEDGFNGISSAVALVPQDPEIFGARDSTVGYNMTVGFPHSQEVIQSCIDLVSFRNVLNKLPKGMDTGVKEKGFDLSGGEKQGLALVRGLLASHDKDIVLLDEPTSSFDPVSERNAYQNIFREFAGKTIISSVHKFHLLPYFDRIYLFSAGKIIASGTLSELQETSPEFQELWVAGSTEPD